MRRSDLVISTKIFDGGSGVNDRGLSRKHLVEGMQASLRRMKLDYVDLVFCHRPDVTTPMEETVRAMNYILDRGCLALSICLRKPMKALMPTMPTEPQSCCLGCSQGAPAEVGRSTGERANGQRRI